MPLPLFDPDRIAAHTPPDRDRYIDLLRVSAILLVVLGHWLAGVVRVDGTEVTVTRLIGEVPETQPATWLFQVMPLFFLVGGAVNARSWSRARAAGEPWPTWVQRRARRLLGPLVALLAVWAPVTVALHAAGLPPAWVSAGIDHALLPVWFLAVYLLTVCLTPLTHLLHRRAGILVIAAAVALTGVVDVLREMETPAVGFASYLLMWGGVHQIGYLWHEDRLPRTPRTAVVVFVGGAVALTLLVTVAGYPIAMVAPGAGYDDNADPPSLALWALAVTQLGAVLLFRRPAERWLQRRWVWAVTAVTGGMLMTVFLWHMTAAVLVGSALHTAGWWPSTGVVDVSWWARRPVWVGLCAIVLAVLVTVFRRFEVVDTPATRVGAPRVLVGVAATVTGLGVVLTGGVYEAETATGLPLVGFGVLVAGLASLGVIAVPGRQNGAHVPP